MENTKQKRVAIVTGSYRGIGYEIVILSHIIELFH